MACHGARRLGVMTDNLFNIIGIEALAAAQGIEFRAPLKTSPALEKVASALRANVASLQADRYMADDLGAAAATVADGSLIGVATANLLPALSP